MADGIEQPRAGTGLVFAAGDLPSPAVTTAAVKRRLAQHAFVVAADGGLVHANALGVVPHLIVGDFDSVPADLLAGYPRQALERHPAAKDELDLELALAAVANAGARDVTVLGAFGDRFDQSLAALLIAARLAGEGQVIDLHGGRHSAWPLVTGATLEPQLEVGLTLSVVALAADAVVSATGLVYPLDELAVGFGTGLGVSNVVAAATATITCVSGLIAVIVERPRQAG